MSDARFSVQSYTGSDVYGILSCPHCGEFNLMFANDKRLVCMCGKFIVDLGETLSAFVSNNNKMSVEKAA